MIELVEEIAKELIRVSVEAAQASEEKAAQLEAVLRATLATLKGEKTTTHLEMDARLKALRDELDAMKTPTVLVIPETI